MDTGQFIRAGRVEHYVFLGHASPLAVPPSRITAFFERGSEEKDCWMSYISSFIGKNRLLTGVGNIKTRFDENKSLKRPFSVITRLSRGSGTRKTYRYLLLLSVRR